MGQLADRIQQLIHGCVRDSDYWEHEGAVTVARAEAIEIDIESLAAINARVEAENDLLRDVLDATDEIEVGKWPALDNAVNALLDWREANERNRIDAASTRREVP